MRLAILQFPASNCEQELTLALKKLQIEFSILNPTENHEPIYDGYVILNTIQNDHLKKLFFAEEKKNKIILGIGEGAKFLVDNGLIPGLDSKKACISIHDNHVEITAEMQLKEDYQLNAFTRYFNKNEKIMMQTQDQSFEIPPGLHFEMQQQGLDVFCFLQDNQPAALCNKKGNVMALLPHRLPFNTLGQLFQSMQDYIAQDVMPLYYQPRS